MDINTVNEIWNVVEKEAESIVSQNTDNLSFNTDSKYIFIQRFTAYYKDIKSKFMESDIVDLDRHKVAAIIICSVVESDVINISYEYNEEDTIFCGNEIIAYNVGLDYMRTSLIQFMKDTSEVDKFLDYSFPEALMCDVDFKTILCRNVWFAKKYFMLNPLEIANTLFLIENYSLLLCNVDLNVLKEKSRRMIND